MDYVVSNTALTATADAIRAKTGDSAAIVFDMDNGFSSAISSIKSGSAGTNDVNFYDYDGTVVASYSAADFANLTALPNNPTHTGLTAQGWNWTLANAKTYVATYGKLNVGQMYITNDGKTRIYIRLDEGRLSPCLGVCPNGTVTVDWGDGSATTTLTGTSVSTVQWTSNHAYSSAGDYTITLTVSGNMGFTGASTANTGSYLLRYASGADNRNYSYRNAIQRVELGSGVTNIGAYAFNYCYNLESVTIPSSVTSIGNYVFQYCYSLGFVVIPSTVTSIGTYMFNNCESLRSVAIPSSVTNLTNYMFSACYSLTNITIPSIVTKISSYMFNNCYTLGSVVIPSSVTSIGDNAFKACYCLGSVVIPSSVTSIGNYVFQNCYSLGSVVIPSKVTSIGNYVFQNCYSLGSVVIPSSVTSIGTSAFQSCCCLGFIKFTSSTPPTVSNSNAFTGIPTDFVIYVPRGSLSTYTSASYYPSSSTYTYVEY